MPIQSGIGKTGNNWQKQDFVIETLEQYPKKICANLWGDRCAMLEVVNIGDQIVMSFDIESREFNGRWYTDVRAFRLAPVAATPNAQPQYAPPAAAQPQYAQPAQPQYTQQPVAQPVVPTAPVVPPAEDNSNMDDDLPF